MSAETQEVARVSCSIGRLERSMRAVLLFTASLGVALASCSTKKTESASVTPSPVVATPALPAGATACAKPATDAADSPACFKFRSAEDAFRTVLASRPAVLAVGEAHAQKGTEKIASSTKRFTETLLPILRGDASDLVVELWAPDPNCQKAVATVRTAQKPVVEQQAATNQDETVVLGTRAKALAITPWLLRPTCDDFARLADAGADAVGEMLGLVKRLTQAKLVQLYDRNRADAGPGPMRMVVAYGGAMHNDLAPAPDLAQYSFGPELSNATAGKYVELDVIVPEYVKDTAIWQKLPWYPLFKAETGPRTDVTLYRLSEKSYVLIFAASPP